ncbi:hypothetical protein [Vibrio barjaei]|uniref:hypothetical protein n=1 Tax=Vibrio barjaei TaxID=1676683 RepID=UPI0022833087|nr:hypothetical protein [Vibrio barjaei]MCY9873845.1 hypothetical protein [Vibrio barjaei]
MEVINIMKEWGREIIFYYKEESPNSVESLCEDLLVDRLLQSSGKVELDFSDLRIGISGQKVHLLAYTLLKAGIKPETLIERVSLTELAFPGINKEFLNSIDKYSVEFCER